MASSSSYQRVEQVDEDDSRPRESIESTSTTSLVLERINNPDYNASRIPYDDPDRNNDEYDDEEDLEAVTEKLPLKANETRVKRMVYIIGALLVGSWCIALIVYLTSEYNTVHDPPKDDDSNSDLPVSGKNITLSQVLQGMWRPSHKDIKWVADPEGKRDGLMLTANELGFGTNAYLAVEDVQGQKQVLMYSRLFGWNDKQMSAEQTWPSRDFKKVLIATNKEHKFRHSYSAVYWVYDVATKEATPLVPNDPDARVSLVVWSPTSDYLAFVKDNNLFIRSSDSNTVLQVTKDGGKDLFYGIPDWVYEEEVFGTNRALWFSDDGKYIAYLRINESEVPEYPIQFFVSRPSHEEPKPGEESYPEVELIKYPKAGAPNPIINIQFWDMDKQESFDVKIEKDFPDDQRLITEVKWAGKKVLVRETNRESDVLRMVLIDVQSRSGKVVREQDVQALDGGWFEVSQMTQYIPADPAKGRTDDGYIDTVIHEGYNHLAYFTPLDNSKPIMLTSGNWEVVDAPSAVDLEKNIVYFVATKESSTGRHVYSVKLDGKDFKNVTDISKDGRYSISFSKQAKYALLNYDGPEIPWQRIIGTESGEPKYSKVIEKNESLKKLAETHALPTFHYSTVNIDGFTLNVVERRPPGFNLKQKYPVLFQVYGGPGSQMVSKSWNIDFQAYLAGALGYVVVTVDGRGTGFIGRKARCIIRGNIGYWEAKDQIETARIWRAKGYVDHDRMAIWGWSYGGFMTLKTLEMDAGKIFKYGMAVAPVTDWRFYDSIYTERYMHTPQNNPKGYANSTISNTTALAQSVRFLLMHGIADDNVHLQNSLTLLDKLDLASVENYDVHVFPDSDHSIYFHNANKMVYDRLENWLTAAFNGDFLDWKARQKSVITRSQDDGTIVDAEYEDDVEERRLGRGRSLLKRATGRFYMEALQRMMDEKKVVDV